MLKIDLHIHTIASGHAFSTINEIVKAASEKKMTVIGIADHDDGKNLDKHYFVALAERVPEKIFNVRVLKGVEANITAKGELGIDEKSLKKIDFAMAAIHSDVYIDKGEKKNTENVLKAMNNKCLKILTHPYFDVKCEINIEKIAKVACQKNIILEVNTSTLKNERFMENPRYKENLRKMIRIVKENKKKVIVNSDAHSEWEVGDDCILTPKLKKEIGLTDELIINNYPEELEKFLGVKF